jgi:hypothetical protein
MLAHTQHFLIQFSSWQVAKSKGYYGSWFQDYAVVGDDVIIADPEVARAYHRNLDDLGVKISLHKSVRSPDASAGEFVKRFIYKGEDLSPISWLEVMSAPAHIGIMVDLIKRFGGSINSMLAVAGYGYKARGSVNQPFGRMAARLRTYVLSFISPGGVEPRTMKDFINATGLYTQSEIPMLSDSSPAVKVLLSLRDK